MLQGKTGEQLKLQRRRRLAADLFKRRMPMPMT
jgi:hypothetical protein